MAHSRDRGKKEKRKNIKQPKKRKGLPPHLEREQQRPAALEEIKRHINKSTGH